MVLDHNLRILSPVDTSTITTITFTVDFKKRLAKEYLLLALEFTFAGY